MSSVKDCIKVADGVSRRATTSLLIIIIKKEMPWLQELEKFRLTGLLLKRCGSYFYACVEPGTEGVAKFGASFLRPVAKLSTCEEAHLQPDESTVPADKNDIVSICISLPW